MLRTLLLLALTPLPAFAAEPIIGQASVIDGDTIEIHGTRIRLYGIDAPEIDQTCVVNGRQSRCGQQSAKQLSDHIGRLTVTCDPRDKDQYGRVVAVCSAAGEDLNAWMVSKGLAIAYRQFSKDYVRQEKAAERANLGMWRGEFIAPSEWRRRRPPWGASEVVTEGCPIKGNISRSGERIYHMPGDENYEKTRINTSMGERYFCTEAEARKAGWRKSKR